MIITLYVKEHYIWQPKKTIANDALSFATNKHHDKYSMLTQENGLDHCSMTKHLCLFLLLHNECIVFVQSVFLFASFDPLFLWSLCIACK